MSLNMKHEILNLEIATSKGHHSDALLGTPTPNGGMCDGACIRQVVIKLLGNA